MKIIKILTLIFSFCSALILIFNLPDQATLNLYVAFVLLATALQGIIEFLAPEKFKALTLDKTIKISMLAIRIGLYFGLTRAFVLHGIKAEIPSWMSSFGLWSVLTLVCTALILIYVNRKALLETVLGLSLFALSLATTIFVGSLGFQETPFFMLSHTASYLLAIYNIWAIATFLAKKPISH